MFNPCVEHCYIKYGKLYSQECNTECEYAKAIKDKQELELVAEREADYRKNILEDIKIFLTSGSGEYKRGESYIFFSKTDLTRLIELIKKLAK